MIAILFPFVWLAAGLFCSASAQTLTPEALLARAIAYHDPQSRWFTRAHILTIRQSRPDGTVRDDRVVFDFPGDRFEYLSRRRPHRLLFVLEGDRCTTLALNGRTELSPEERKAYGLTCDRGRRYRDYFSYLWGLPMKLRDPGTRLHAVESGRFLDRQVLALRVTYDPQVGSDTWYFYFDPQSAALVGYRFYHDEAKNDGEYIVLSGEIESGNIRLPVVRRWYTNDGDRYLGTDSLMAFTSREN